MQIRPENADVALSRIAHDLSQPLNALLAATRVLRTANSQMTVDHAGAIIERQAVYMQGLVGKLLADGRRRSHARTRRVPIDMREIVTDVLDANQALCAAHHLAASAILPDVPMWVAGDPVCLREILWNLISNAVRHTSPGGRIVAHVTSRGHEVVITVSDTGIGLEPHEIEAILRAFVAGEHTQGERRGLGLAVAWELIRAHGGTIDVHSAGRGHGSEFRVMLPAGSAP